LSFGPARSYYYPARIFWHVFIWDPGPECLGWKELVLWCWPVVLFVAAKWRVFWAICPRVPGATMSSQWRCRHVFLYKYLSNA
jgi:hypothetical protein